MGSVDSLEFEGDWIAELELGGMPICATSPRHGPADGSSGWRSWPHRRDSFCPCSIPRVVERFDESESRLIAVVHAPPMTGVRLGLDLLSANELRRVPVGGSGWLLVVFGRGTSRVSTAAVSKRGHRLDDGLERCVGRHQEGYVGCAGQVPSGELGLGVVG